MKVSAAGRKAIAAHEGVRLKAYPDPATGGEPWTIGVGHTSAAGLPKVSKGMTITAEECDEILSRDLETFERAVESAVKVPLNQNQFDALVSFTFNVGARNLQKSTLLRKLNVGDYQGAADQFPVWNKAAGKVMKGLVTRRAEERALFLRAPPAKTTIVSPGVEVESLPKAPYPTPLDVQSNTDQTAYVPRDQSLSSIPEPSAPLPIKDEVHRHDGTHESPPRFWSSLFAVLVSALKGRRNA